MSILSISNEMLWAFEKQSITALIANDLSEALDTVDHAILLKILTNKYGIYDKALDWFDQYLHPRAFKDVIEGKYSNPHDLTVSVPQGSCARAGIFILYCSPLSEVVPDNLHLSGFADDHSIRKTFKAGNQES